MQTPCPPPPLNRVTYLSSHFASRYEQVRGSSRSPPRDDENRKDDRQRERQYCERVADVGVEGHASNGRAPAESAAWTVVANVLLNLDETITQG